jgi:hypothetical protein
MTFCLYHRELLSYYKTSHGWRSLEGQGISEVVSPGANAALSGHGGDVGRWGALVQTAQK